MNTPKLQLTTEQLDALIASPTGLLDPQLSGLQETLADLRSTAVTAADLYHRNAKSSSRASRTPLTAWALATTAIIACAVTPLALHHHAQPTPVPIATVAITQSVPTSAPTVSDEALYAEVQADLSASVPSPMLPLTPTTTPSTH